MKPPETIVNYHAEVQGGLIFIRLTTDDGECYKFWIDRREGKDFGETISELATTRGHRDAPASPAAGERSEQG